MRPFGTHAYVLSKRGAEKLLRRAWKATYHVDCVISGIVPFHGGSYYVGHRNVDSQSYQNG
eukprot:scaffold1697_cov180-Amphora_coffeaeformis.AAC.31